MRVVGFNFTKISIEKLKEITEIPKIKTEINIPEIKGIKSTILKSKDEIIEAKFEYIVNYEPELAKVNIEGRALLSIDPKIARDILKQWKKKKMPEEFRMLLFNVVMRKSALKALLLEDELNLPLHTPLPSLKRTKEK
jgi:endonuclease V-like protein UPF0215 family